mgnify:CR=1 FL=1|tara:strand:+ start:839 stop:1000 length:162 start_codon:yes stop_codon:yes gene_type:complete
MYTNLKITKKKVVPKIKIIKTTKKGHYHNDGVAIRNKNVIKPINKKKTMKKKT